MTNKSDFEIPEAMRDIASSSMSEARKAFERFVEAAEDATSRVEGSAQAMTESTRSLNQEAMKLAQQNMTKTFDYAEKMMQARDPSEFFALQQEYLKAQMETFAGEAKKFADLATKAGADVMKKG